MKYVVIMSWYCNPGATTALYRQHKKYSTSFCQSDASNMATTLGNRISLFFRTNRNIRLPTNFPFCIQNSIEDTSLYGRPDRSKPVYPSKLLVGGINSDMTFVVFYWLLFILAHESCPLVSANYRYTNTIAETHLKPFGHCVRGGTSLKLLK